MIPCLDNPKFREKYMKDIRICFVGDSFVNGTGDPEKLGWTGRLCTLSESPEREITYYNLGVRRDTSGHILERWERECAARLPESFDRRLVLSFGVNDCTMENGLREMELGKSIDNAHIILSRAARHYQTLMIGPPPIDDQAINVRTRDLDTALEELCHDLKIPYLSVFESLLAAPAWMEEVASNDGAHPRAKGYAQLAHLIREWEGWWF